MDNVSYDRLKKQMRQIIRMAKEVIEEIEKNSPDDILISDIATEEMDDLVQEIFSTIVGNDAPARLRHSNL